MIQKMKKEMRKSEVSNNLYSFRQSVLNEYIHIQFFQNYCRESKEIDMLVLI